MMKRVSEKRHWNRFWAASPNLDDVYGTDGRIVENLGKYVELSGKRVLEVGAGTGRDSAVLASAGAEVYALDFSEEALNLMKNSLGSPARIVCGDALGLPFVSECFDVVFHQGLLEHFREPVGLLDENIRVLKRGGVLLVDVPQRYHYYTVLKHVLIFFGKWFAGWETEFSVGQLRSLVESRGMHVMGLYGYNLFPPVWYRAFRRVLLRIGLKLPMGSTESRIVSETRRFFRSLVPQSLYRNTAMVIGCVARKP